MKKSALLLGACALALAGFAAKLGLIQAGLEQGQYAIVAVALAASLLTLVTMVQLWNEAFWKPAPAGAPANSNMGFPPHDLSKLLLPLALLAAITILIGLGAGPLYALAQRSAEQLLAPAAYIRAVMGRP